MHATNTTPLEDVTKGHLRGSALLVAGRILAILMNFLVQVVTVRYLPIADYGIFAFALSIVSVVAVLSAFGMDKAASRFLPVYLQDRDYRRFWGALGLSFGTVLGLGALTILLFLCLWGMELPLLTADRRTQAVLAIMAGLALFEALDALFISLFAVLDSAGAIFVRRYLLGPLLKLAAAIAVVITSGDVYVFAAGQLIAGLLGVAVCFVMLLRILKKQSDLHSTLSARPTFPVRQLYSYSATLLSGDLSYLLRIAMVPIVVGVLYASEDVAAYQAVMPLARLNEFVLVTFSVLFLPSAAKLAAADRHVELQALFEKSTAWITLLSFPIFAVSFLASEFLSVSLFGAQYKASADILAWLAIGFYTNASFGTSLRLLRASARLRTLLAADLLMIVVASALIFCLVPRYGALGGAWAVCGAYVSQSLIYYLLVARSTHVNPFTSRCIAPYFVGVMLCVISGRLREWLGLPPVFGVIAAFLTSVAVLMMFWRQLELSRTFPELARLPIVGRWIVPVAVNNANPH